MKVISFINMKGGVAKTTLCINVGDYLVRQKNRRVLIVDIDPQFNATQCLLSPADYEKRLQAGQSNILDIFDSNVRPSVGSVSGAKVVPPAKLEDIKPITIKPNFDLLPGNLNLYRLEMAPGGGREHRLGKYLQTPAVQGRYDYVLVDTPPTPSVWMSSALLASDFYLIPVKPDPISFTGIDLLKRVIDELKENYSTKLRCAGVVLTIAETNTIVYQACRRYLCNDPYWKAFIYPKPLMKKTVVARGQASQQMILDTNDGDLKYALALIADELESRVSAKPPTKIPTKKIKAKS